MKRLIITTITCLAVLSSCKTKATDAPITGHLTIYENFPSKYVESRSLRVWTPSDYDPSMDYDVIYMNDGQNLFDSTITWNKQEWGVDEVLTRLISSGEIRPCIAVGIDNTSKRYEEYYPSDICKYVPEGVIPEDFIPLGDEYLRFVVEEVKPYIDSLYSTAQSPSHTFIMGSSCGGLISAYAFCRYPEIFCGAACLSTHSSLMNPYTQINQKPASEAFIAYFMANLPADNEHMLYMDCGDCPIDLEYKESQSAINSHIAGLDWSKDHYMYRFFPGQTHSENDWRSRLDIPITFLMKPQP